MVRGGMRAAVACATAVLVLAGCGEGPDRSTGSQTGSDKPYASAGQVPERLGGDGTTIQVGDPGAPTVVRVYEDPRCPGCREFEVAGGGPALSEAVLERRVRAEYVFASFLDDSHGGDGSKKAVNALRAALDESRFMEYHEVLYAAQPEAGAEEYTDARLLELAEKVPGLRGPAFDAAVTSMKHRSFVTASERAYERAGGAHEPNGPGTPTAFIDDKRVSETLRGVLYDEEAFGELLRQIGRDPEGWQDSAL